MSFHLIPHSRRSFLTTTASAGCLLLSSSPISLGKDDPGEDSRPADANKIAMISDTHIAGDRATVARGVNMFDNFNAIIDEILAEDQRPIAAIINGDCAYLKGLADDYRSLRFCVDRLTNGGIPVHMNMGNHDDRRPFYEAFTSQRPAHLLVEGKHVSVIEHEHANLFMIDSLRIVNNVTGEIGTIQMKWLAEALAKYDDKPAIIIGHHNPQFESGADGKVSGLADTSAFFELIDHVQHAKAYIFGHTHNWNLAKSPGGTTLINQPPTAYVFSDSRPSGWVRMNLSPGKATLQLRCLDTKHPEHEQVFDVT